MDLLTGFGAGLLLGVLLGRLTAGPTTPPDAGRRLSGAERTALDRDVRAALRDQGKIEAIKLWRERTGADLRASKHAVDEIERSGGG